MKKLIPGLLIVYCATLPVAVLMASDAATPAQSIVPLCQGCHGSQGEGRAAVGGMPASPRLAGQIREYLVQSLGDYKNGVRNNPMMSAIAKGLSDEEIAGVAAYYADLDQAGQ